MPKKKGQKKVIAPDFTINDCANAPKPIRRLKKSENDSITVPNISWDEISDNTDILEEVSEDGTKCFVFKKKQKNGQDESSNDVTGIDYPEMIWYQISKHIAPEDVGRFAAINHTTYSVTKRKTFWVNIYKKYCQNSPLLPNDLKIDEFVTYGLRTKVIRALYHTYRHFVNMVRHEVQYSSKKPHDLVRHRCLNIMFCKRRTHWSILLKFKKPTFMRRETLNMIKELEKVDANPEEGAQIMQVNCQQLSHILPLIGMTLTSVNMSLSKGFSHYRLHLGFNTGQHVSQKIFPECSVVIDTVTSVLVLDWWNPAYPAFNISLPSKEGCEQLSPYWNDDIFSTE